MMSSLKMKTQVVKMKVCVVGHPGAGKSHLIRRLTQEEGEEGPTQEYEVSIYILDTKSCVMEVHLWDCSTHFAQIHKHLKQAFFRNSSATLLLFDVTNNNWEQQAHYWISEAYDNQCYLVYAIATNIEQYLENKWTGNNGQSIESPFLSEQIDGIKDRAAALFKQYGIRLHFLQSNKSIKKHFEDLFVQMHDESQVVSRGSVARGIQLPFLQEISFDSGNRSKMQGEK